MRVVQAIQRRKQNEVQQARVLQQELAHLLAFAFNDPKNIPDLTQDRDGEPDGGGDDTAKARQGLLAFMASRNETTAQQTRVVKA